MGRSRPRSQGFTWTLLGGLALGAGFGAATSLSSAIVSPSSPESLARVPSLILGSGWAWAGIAILAGFLAAAPVRAVASGALALLARTAAYYGMDSVIRDEALSWYWPEVVRWWLASVIFGPVLGGIGATARRPGALGLLCRLAVAAGAFVELIIHPPGSGATIESSATTWARTIVATLAGLSAAIFLSRHLLAQRRAPARDP